MTKSVLQMIQELQAARTASRKANLNRPVKGRGKLPEEPPAFPAPQPPPPTYRQALAGLVDRPFLASQNWQEQQWRADREGAHPDILEFERVLIRRMAKLGVPMFASEVLRSPERQEDLFALGHSRARAGQSAHPYGCAVDIVHSVKGWKIDRKQWDLVGHVGREVIKQKGLALVSLAWGGDWSFYDPAHWEVKDWKMVRGNYPWLKTTK